MKNAQFVGKLIKMDVKDILSKKLNSKSSISSTSISETCSSAFARLSKVYILKTAELNNGIDIYVTPYLNLFLVWNKGIAFGLLSVEESLMYNIVTVIIMIITLIYRNSKNKKACKKWKIYRN